MFSKSARRTWLLFSAAGALAIVALGWFMLIRTETATQDDVRAQAADARTQAAVSRAHVAGLRAENRKLPAYKAELDVLKRALPVGASTAAFVSDMQALSRASDVTITAINATPGGADSGAPQTVGGAAPLPITITAAGTPERLERFLDLLQTKASRAFLIGTVTEAVPTEPSSKTPPTITVGMKAFYTAS